MQDRICKRNDQLRRSIGQWPGSLPYDNYRPINVPARFDGQTLYQSLIQMHPHVGPQQWQEWFERGHILSGETPVAMETVVRGGQQYRHLFPEWVEPEIDWRVVVLWEDDWMIAVDKPAPLPVHPSGRFNRNTLVSLLGTVYQKSDLRVVHRLDANTTGVLILARTAQVATALRQQFQASGIDKRYLVKAAGQPQSDSFSCHEPIARARTRAGLRTIDRDGLAAQTDFRVIDRVDDGASLLAARPRTGRTNQIRIHLWALGMPVCGDPAYLKQHQLAPTQTLSPYDPPMCLHAAQLRLRHPATAETIAIEGPPPAWLAELG